MRGGTLMLSRHVNFHSHYKMRLEDLGFKDVTLSALDRDALNIQINELRPSLVLVSFAYHEICTPFMMGRLMQQFPGLNIAAVSIAPYPADTAMRFIANGVKSCVYYYDGIDQFYRGLDCVREGKKFVSKSIQDRIEMRTEQPKPAQNITDRHIEVIRLICCGWTGDEIADELGISSRTVDAHKRLIFHSLDVRNENELIGVARHLKLVSDEELFFRSRHFELKPKADPKLLLKRIK
jgi:DNA-binding NarL/FixJ family response regulator